MLAWVFYSYFKIMSSFGCCWVYLFRVSTGSSASRCQGLNFEVSLPSYVGFFLWSGLGTFFEHGGVDFFGGLGSLSVLAFFFSFQMLYLLIYERLIEMSLRQDSNKTLFKTVLSCVESNLLMWG